MDPITKALHETWKNIVTEGKAVTRINPETGKKEYYIQTGGKSQRDERIETWLKDPKNERLVLDTAKRFFGKNKTPTPGKTPYDDRAGGEDDAPTPTPKEDELIPYINPDPSPFPHPRYIEREPKPIIPTRSPAPQPAAPATTGSGLLNNIMNLNKKAYKTITGSLPTMPKIYEERDAEGQMAKGELMNLASKAQELADMMKDDTQLEAWVQSKITKAKDYISSVHDYMNGNPDKID